MYQYIKRVLDLIIAVILMIIFLIPMIIIGILIKFDSKGPVFFKQERTGKMFMISIKKISTPK